MFDLALGRRLHRNGCGLRIKWIGAEEAGRQMKPECSLPPFQKKRICVVGI